MREFTLESVGPLPIEEKTKQICVVCGERCSVLFQTMGLEQLGYVRLAHAAGATLRGHPSWWLHIVCEDSLKRWLFVRGLLPES